MERTSRVNSSKVTPPQHLELVCWSEFSQDTGPVVFRLYNSPNNTQVIESHKLDDFVTSIMEVDVQNSSESVDSYEDDKYSIMNSTIEGCNVVAFIQRTTILDFYARGFVRLVCFTYISSDKTKIYRLLNRLKTYFRDVTNQIRSSNQSQFLMDLSSALESRRAEEILVDEELDRQLEAFDLNLSDEKWITDQVASFNDQAPKELSNLKRLKESPSCGYVVTKPMDKLEIFEDYQNDTSLPIDDTFVLPPSLSSNADSESDSSRGLYSSTDFSQEGSFVSSSSSSQKEATMRKIGKKLQTSTDSFSSYSPPSPALSPANGSQSSFYSTMPHLSVANQSQVYTRPTVQIGTSKRIDVPPPLWNLPTASDINSSAYREDSSLLRYQPFSVTEFLNIWAAKVDKRHELYKHNPHLRRVSSVHPGSSSSSSASPSLIDVDLEIFDTEQMIHHEKKFRTQITWEFLKSHTLSVSHLLQIIKIIEKERGLMHDAQNTDAVKLLVRCICKGGVSEAAQTSTRRVGLLKPKTLKPLTNLMSHSAFDLVNRLLHNFTLHFGRSLAVLSLEVEDMSICRLPLFVLEADNMPLISIFPEWLRSPPDVASNSFEFPVRHHCPEHVMPTNDSLGSSYRPPKPLNVVEPWKSHFEHLSVLDQITFRCPLFHSTFNIDLKQTDIRDAIFSLFIGRPLLIIGSPEIKRELVTLVKFLAQFVVVCHPEKKKKLYNSWYEGKDFTLRDLLDFKLIGIGFKPNLSPFLRDRVSRLVIAPRESHFTGPRWYHCPIREQIPRWTTFFMRVQHLMMEYAEKACTHFRLSISSYNDPEDVRARFHGLYPQYDIEAFSIIEHFSHTLRDQVGMAIGIKDPNTPVARYYPIKKKKGSTSSSSSQK